jgi:hypothetical protein
MPVLLLAAYATGIVMVRFVAQWNISGLSVTTILLFLAWALLRHSPWSTLPLLGMLLLAGLTNANHALNRRRSRPNYPLAIKIAPAIPIRQPGRIRLSSVPCCQGNSCNRFHPF